MELDDIDVDLDFGTNPIKEFLQRKLEEIQHSNGKLEKQITEKTEMLQRCLDTNTGVGSESLQITDVWKKIHNDKCVFGFHLRNSCETRKTTITKLLLNWNSSTYITYRFKIFEWKSPEQVQYLEAYPAESDNISSESLAVLVVDKPNFSKQVRYDITGVIIHTTNSPKGEEIQLSVPTLEIQVRDFIDCSLEINAGDLLARDAKSLFTCLSAKEQFILVTKVPEDENIVTILRDGCKYKQVDFVSGDKLFVIDAICSNINGSLIQVIEKEEEEEGDVVTLKLICSNQEVLQQILHHMYACTSGLYILPKSHAIYFSQPTTSEDATGSDEANRKKFADSLSKQIEFIGRFCKGKVKECSRENYLNFRKQLNVLQLETDILYTKCNNC